MAEKLVPLLIAANTIAFTFRNRTMDLAVTAFGFYALVKGVVLGFNGPPADAWVFGMAFAGLALKTFNWRYFLTPDKLVRKDAGQASSVRSSIQVHGVIGSSSGTSLINTALTLCFRVWDSLQMVLSGRGIGWKFELRGLPRPPPGDISRARFVIEQTWAVIWRYIVMDITRQFLLSTGIAGSPPLRGPMDYPLLIQLLVGALLWQWVRWKMDLPYRAASIVGVFLRYGEPKDWPPFFGSWRESWTVRRLWAKSWHQSLRLQTEPPVVWLFDQVLQVKRDSYLSRYGRVIGIFFMAFVVHAYARILAGGHIMIDWKYFMSQPIIIAFEDAFQYFVFDLGLIQPGWRASKWLGYAWVFVVQTWTLAYWEDEIVRMGLFADPVFGFTIVGKIGVPEMR